MMQTRMGELVRSGKVRFVRVPNFASWHLTKTAMLATDAGVPVVSQQINHSCRQVRRNSSCSPRRSTAVWAPSSGSPLAEGLLTGKYHRDGAGPADGRRTSGWTDPPIPDEDRLFDTVDTLVELSADRHATVAQLAIGTRLGTDPAGITSLNIGARTTDQLRSNLVASSVTLTLYEFAAPDRVSALSLPYPYLHQWSIVSDRLDPRYRALLASMVLQ